MAPNFAECKAKFDASQKLRDDYEYTPNRPLPGAYKYLNPPPLLITNAGCNAVCGHGAEFYTWEDSSATISTWILPVIGLLLQLPYESNEFISTLFFVARVLGSPISTMSYLLWNIQISSKCALFIDMSTDYDNYPEEDSQYEQMRDSFYLLSVMNQYSIKRRMPRISAERLLRIALWSDSLQLETVEDESRSLVKRRRKLAKSIRESRRRGVVPVFVTLMWFLFSLIVSIQAAFGQLGENATAHNLALGWLLSWLPSLVLFSVVDRNPIAADAIKGKLNKLIDATRRALLDPDLRASYIRDIQRREKDFKWTDELRNDDFFQDEFFTRFSGQGRVRWHSGVAPSILAGIESTPIARWRRGWLNDDEKAREILVKGPEQLYGLHWFDRNALWQLLGSFFFVGVAITGAFIISYYTPTVGLGCRSGGYVIYLVIATTNTILEALCWAFIDEGQMADGDPFTKIASNVNRKLSKAQRRSSWRMRLSDTVTDYLERWKKLTARDKWEILLLRPLDAVNSIWLIYIVLSQVFGAYQTCDCQSSLWSNWGGFVDFESYAFYRGVGVSMYWGVSTGISCFALSIAFAHATIEWVQQSHMATLDYYTAQKGLRNTRWFRRQGEKVVGFFTYLMAPYPPRWGRVPDQRRGRLTLRWTSKSENEGSLHPQRTSTVELEDATIMSRDVSRSSFGDQSLPVPQGTPRIGTSHSGPSTFPNSHIRSSGVSLGEQEWSIAMSRDGSHSSQGIERKPLMPSSDRSHHPANLSLDQSGRSPRTSANMSRVLSNNSEDIAIEDNDDIGPLHTIPPHFHRPRHSYGESDLHPPAIPRSTPRQSAEEFELPSSIPRSQAY